MITSAVSFYQKVGVGLKSMFAYYASNFNKDIEIWKMYRETYIESMF
jgi:hypothetical protein